MAGFYQRHILPRLIHRTCADDKFAARRALIVPRASGVVVEWGMGSGLNLPFYDPGKVTRVIGVDPSEKLAQLARTARERAPFRVDYLHQGAESLPLEDNSVDTVLSTFTICTIAGLAQAFAEARRVLKPGGQLLFCEHGLASDPPVARWQNRLDPLWTVFAGGCHLNRDIPALVRDGGFEIADLDTGYLKQAPRIGGFLFSGAASMR